jgi:hypothetical protein
MIISNAPHSSHTPSSYREGAPRRLRVLARGGEANTRLGESLFQHRGTVPEVLIQCRPHRFPTRRIPSPSPTPSPIPSPTPSPTPSSSPRPPRSLA